MDKVLNHIANKVGKTVAELEKLTCSEILKVLYELNQSSMEGEQQIIHNLVKESSLSRNDKELYRLANDKEYQKQDAEIRRKLVEDYKDKASITLFEGHLMARSGLSIENVRNALKTIGNRSKELGYEELLDVVGTFKQLPHEEHLEFVNKVAGKFHIGFFLIMMKVIDELLNDVLKDVLKNIKLVKENN